MPTLSRQCDIGLTRDKTKRTYSGEVVAAGGGAVWSNKDLESCGLKELHEFSTASQSTMLENKTKITSVYRTAALTTSHYLRRHRTDASPGSKAASTAAALSAVRSLGQAAASACGT